MQRKEYRIIARALKMALRDQAIDVKSVEIVVDAFNTELFADNRNFDVDKFTKAVFAEFDSRCN